MNNFVKDFGEFFRAISGSCNFDVTMSIIGFCSPPRSRRHMFCCRNRFSLSCCLPIQIFIYFWDRIGCIARYIVLRKLIRNVLQSRFKLLERQPVKAFAELSEIKILTKCQRYYMGGRMKSETNLANDTYYIRTPVTMRNIPHITGGTLYKSGPTAVETILTPFRVDNGAVVVRSSVAVNEPSWLFFEANEGFSDDL